MARTSEMLNQIKDYYHLSRNAEFARFFNISEQNAYSWTKRGTFDIKIVYAHCPEISADWLISGEGEMLRKDRGEGRSAPGESSEMLLSAFQAIEREQEALKEAQAQLAAMIEIVKSLTSRDK